MKYLKQMAKRLQSVHLLSSTVKKLQKLEPIIKSTILCPDKYVGDVIELAMAKRGVQRFGI